ncbi:hypothetical protein G6F47_013916 [Rhizopus delemar]|nr:hypothetical protein G6F47_013916 [Rhizopus delemar]
MAALLRNVAVEKSWRRPIGFVLANSVAKSVRSEMRIVETSDGREVKFSKAGGYSSGLVYSNEFDAIHDCVSGIQA